MTAESPATGPRPQRLIVVGSGIAGLYAALLAADAGAEVVLLTKGALADSNTYYAQGGISAVLDEPAPGDTVAAHIADTLKAGAGHCNEEPSGCSAPRPAWTSPGCSASASVLIWTTTAIPPWASKPPIPRPRILHAGGDATGARVAQALIGAVLDAQAAGGSR